MDPLPGAVVSTLVTRCFTSWDWATLMMQVIVAVGTFAASAAFEQQVASIEPGAAYGQICRASET